MLPTTCTTTGLLDGYSVATHTWAEPPAGRRFARRQSALKENSGSDGTICSQLHIGRNKSLCVRGPEAAAAVPRHGDAGFHPTRHRRRSVPSGTSTGCRAHCASKSREL